MLLICSSRSLLKMSNNKKSTVVTVVSSRSLHLACYIVMIRILLATLYKNCLISLTHISFESSFFYIGQHLFCSIPWFKCGAFFPQYTKYCWSLSFQKLAFLRLRPECLVSDLRSKCKRALVGFQIAMKVLIFPFHIKLISRWLFRWKLNNCRWTSTFRANLQK